MRLAKLPSATYLGWAKNSSARQDIPLTQLQMDCQAWSGLNRSCAQLRRLRVKVLGKDASTMHMLTGLRWARPRRVA